MDAHSFEALAPQRAVMEGRVAYCYEVDGACPCDDTVCRLPADGSRKEEVGSD
jgi:hypothetical protein